jgi:hypothetical protein
VDFPASPPASQALRCGLVVLTRADPRLLAATLDSIDQLARAPDRISVLVPAGREHVFADVIANASQAVPVRMVKSRADGSALDQGFGSIAAEVDIVLFVPEGVILEAGYLDSLVDKAGRWDDLVGEIDVAARAIKRPVDAPVPALEVLRRQAEWAYLPILRQWLRARSAMACLMWVRVAACGNIKFVQLPEFCDFIALALFLDRLRSRGRTALLFSGQARHVRLLPERRTGFDVGYALFSHLGHVADYDDQRDVAPGHPSYLNQRLEMARLLSEQALQCIVSPRSKRHVTTFLRGMWAARRDARIQSRRIRREIRELG